MNSVFKNIKLINLQEMKDWKQHFINGTKGMPKTDPAILNYVEGLLKKQYDGNEEKVNNNPIAPWLVNIIKDIGPANINTEKINRIKTVIEYVKINGNVANIPKMDLIQGSDFAKEKLDKSAEREKNKGDKKPEEDKQQEEKPKEKKELTPEQKALIYQKQSKKDFPELPDELNGKIERVWTCTDGSGRMWVKVIDNKWLKEKCDGGVQWGIGGTCQSGSFGNSGYVNYQLIGPPKDQKLPILTLIGMAVLKSSSSIAEVKDIGNNQPGSTITYGWSDLDIQLIDFLCQAPETKWIQYFGDYYGKIQLNINQSLYGGGIGFLYHLSKKRPELFKKLANRRPDIIEANMALIKSAFGNVDELINFNITEFSQKNPEIFLRKIEEYIGRFGQEAKDALIALDLENYAKNSPELIQTILPYLTGIISVKKLQSLIDLMDLSNFIYNNKLVAYEWFKKLSSLGEYKNVLNDITKKYSPSIIKGSGDGVKGVISFLREMEKPKLNKHQNAKKDFEDGKYYGEREENIKDENGKDVLDANGVIQKRLVRFQIPDDLLIMNQKERRDFININKEYIENSINSDATGKEITYLRLLFSQSNFQEIEKNMKKEREKFINYYDTKFRLGQKKRVQTPNQEEITEVSYIPGEFELFSIINPKGIVADKGKTYYPIGVENTKNSKNSIIKYYHDIAVSEAVNEIKKQYGKRLTEEIIRAELKQRDAKMKYSALKDYILTLIYSGENEETALEYFLTNFSPEKLNLNLETGYTNLFLNLKNTISDGLFYKTLEEFKSKLFNIGQFGADIYKKYIDLLQIVEFQIKKGDMIEYKNDEDPKLFGKNWNKNIHKDVIDNGPIFLTEGRRYRVLDVDKYAGSKNGKVLIKDEGFLYDEENKVSPTERWFNSKLFRVRSVLISQNINEEILRNFVKKRIEMISESKSISYTGIVLDNKSQNKLQEWIKQMIKDKKIPSFDDWKISADHVTINTGKSKDINLIGKSVEIKVLQYAYDKKTCAISIIPIIDDIEIEFTKEKPHITLAYDVNNGARPIMSNELKNWKPVPKSFVLNGIIKEVEL